MALVLESGSKMMSKFTQNLPNKYKLLQCDLLLPLLETQQWLIIVRRHVYSSELCKLLNCFQGN